jgi:hypothetical protein
MPTFLAPASGPLGGASKHGTTNSPFPHPGSTGLRNPSTTPTSGPVRFAGHGRSRLRTQIGPAAPSGSLPGRPSLDSRRPMVGGRRSLHRNLIHQEARR